MILFVCTGNTCRSPMAAALARSRGADARSAGLAAYPGDPATPQAVRAAARHGADLSGHRAQPVTEALMREAAQVWAMTEGHLNALRLRYPEYEGKIAVLTPAIPDPFGGGDDTYERCILRLIQALDQAGIAAD